MEENWYALFIATQVPVTVEQAFAALHKSKRTKKKRYVPNDTELFEMQKLRDEGMSYEKIGSMYGVSAEAIRMRLRKFRKKREMRVGA
jgi:hypothetical protein